MSDPALNSAKSMSKPVLKPMTVSVDGLITDSATPLQGQRKGFPVMPGVHNMKPMSVRNVPVDTRCGPNKYRAANGPTVEDWEAVLVGRTFIFPEAVRLSARQSFSSDADWRREKGLWNAADAKLGLRSSVRQSKGAMGRLPPEVVRMIEQVLQDDEDRTTVSMTDLPANTKCCPSPLMHQGVIGRMRVYLDSDRIVTSVSFG